MKTHFGLDIGTTSIKVVALKKDSHNISLDAIALSPLMSNGLLSESPVDQQVVADSIKNILTQAGIKEKEVNLAIPESSVYTKILQMPQLSDQELAAALRWEMEQYIPMPIDKVRTDWQILQKKTTENKTMDVLLVAAPLSTIQKYEAVLTYAGLVPAAVETEILSVHRALQPLVSTMPSIIVHLGASSTDVAVVKDGLLNIVFSIGVGGLAITRAIALDLGIDTKQAEDYKKAYGLTKDAFQGKIGKSLYPIVESIVGDIKKVMLSYKQNNNNEEIQQVVLSGGNALLPGLDVFLTNTLNTQVVIGNCWTVNNIKNVPEQVQSDFSRFTVVVGLALRDLV
ncbi:MAG TPA: type IV pilus assembly protein PilM [Candidatus Levybacteria bacterium]|nr:type IV pilus assembly protein PilM [Candidatus Levybacteria bacterium]